MSHLVRTKQGNFKIEQACSLEDIQNRQFSFLKAKDVLPLPVYQLNDVEYKKVSNGNEIALDLEDDEVLLVYQGEEIAIYKKNDLLYKPTVMLI